jgi:cell division transport system ATP-binding protein
MSLLQEINKLGTTMLVVMHEMNLVEQFTNRMIVIDDGLIVSDGMNG